MTLRSNGRIILVTTENCGAPNVVLDGVRRRLGGLRRFSFPRRIITGPVADGDEVHQTVTAAQFEDLSRTGRFYCRWSVGGRHFALPASVSSDLAAGRQVVVAACGETLAALCAAAGCPVLLVRLRRADTAVQPDAAGLQSAGPEPADIGDAADDLPASCEEMTLAVGGRDNPARVLARGLIGLTMPLPPAGMPVERHPWT